MIHLRLKMSLTREINWEDVTEFEYLMRNNEGIMNSQLNSSGGLVGLLFIFLI